jgi:hypothetical protein
MPEFCKDAIQRDDSTIQQALIDAVCHRQNGDSIMHFTVVVENFVELGYKMFYFISDCFLVIYK